MKSFRAMSVHTAAVVVLFLVCPALATAGVEVWNYDVPGDAFRVKTPGPLKPVTIVGARNGTFSGAVAVSSDKPIEGLKASMGTLTGESGTIPADGVLIRYAVAWTGHERGPGGLDILRETPPKSVPVGKKRDALAGVWVTVTVPATAKAGSYRGKLTVEATGLPAKTVSVELTVTDMQLADPVAWKTWTEMIQSPDTLSLEYDVPLWSDQHWEMIAKSFRLMAPSGSRVVYIPILRCTNQGNSEGMIRWIPQADGSYKFDFSIMEKYLDVAEKNLGKPRLVVFYVWDAYLVLKHRRTSFLERPKEPGPAQKRWDIRQKGLTVTIMDEKTGKTSPGFVPHYSGEKARKVWKGLFDDIRKRMRRRELEDAMALGMITDLEASKEEVAFLKDVTGNLSWIAHSHYRRTRGHPSPNKILAGIADVRYEAHAYGLTFHVNPAKNPTYGWRIPELRVYIDRFGLLNGPALQLRQMPQLNITGEQRGLGRIGADFWDVIRDKRGRRIGRAFDRYPENHWRGLNVANYLLAPGAKGPVATARFENLREGLQECEARILLENALLDPAQKSRLGADLAKRARTALDAHQWAMWRGIWGDEKQLQMLGPISGRGIYEAMWEGLSKAGIKMPGFWDGSARSWRARELREGIDRFVASNWKEVSKDLFAVAADAQKRLK